MIANCDLDALLAHSDALLKGSDELVNALYVPHRVEAISRCLSAFASSIKELHLIVEFTQLAAPSVSVPSTSGGSMDEVNQRVSSLKLGVAPSQTLPEGSRKDRRWFDVCFEQIRQINQSIEV